MTPGPLEITLILVAILLLFGAKRIPEIARGLGKGIREFKDATQDIKQELTVHDAPTRPIPQQTYAQTPHVPPQAQATPPPVQQAPEPTAAPPAEGQTPSE